jgi:hypothetical protein
MIVIIMRLLTIALVISMVIVLANIPYREEEYTMKSYNVCFIDYPSYKKVCLDVQSSVKPYFLGLENPNLPNNGLYVVDENGRHHKIHSKCFR